MLLHELQRYQWHVFRPVNTCSACLSEYYSTAFFLFNDCQILVTLDWWRATPETSRFSINLDSDTSLRSLWSFFTCLRESGGPSLNHCPVKFGENGVNIEDICKQFSFAFSMRQHSGRVISLEKQCLKEAHVSVRGKTRTKWKTIVVFYHCIN